jgi:hypothetical protein
MVIHDNRYFYHEIFLLFIYQNTHECFWQSHFQAVKQIIILVLEEQALLSVQTMLS